MYCDYVFIKARRAFRERCYSEMWADLKKAAAKAAARGTVELPKGSECEAPKAPDFPLYFVDYVDCIHAPNPQPLTNPDQLIGWERK